MLDGLESSRNKQWELLKALENKSRELEQKGQEEKLDTHGAQNLQAHIGHTKALIARTMTGSSSGGGNSPNNGGI